ncbi:MAG: acetyltransferase [Yoonia sp.]|uniref:acetyltransferase n=1 Tax=Yoonia sp. TaxID=2212373 RepID=UPI003EF4B1C1
MSVDIDVTANRRRREWGFGVQVSRVLWAACQPLFRFSPRPCWGWRRVLLRLFGAQVGSEAHIYPTVRITMPWHLCIGAQAAVGDHARLYALGRIEIGARATVSQYAHLCAGTHDLTRADRALCKAPILVRDDAWVCADAFVGPGVIIGRGAVLGARAVAMRDLPDGSTGVGNPMQVKGVQR